MTTTVIGQRVTRRDGRAKVTGEAIYGIDIDEKRLAHARVLRSPVPAGRIVKLDTGRAAAMPGVVCVLTAADTPDAHWGMVVKDQTTFASDRVRFVGEPIAVVVAETWMQANAAVRGIELEIAEEPAALDVATALDAGAPIVHPDWESFALGVPMEVRREGNLAWESSLVQGDVDAAFARDDVVIVEGEYRSQRQHQVAIEPHACVARYERGRYTIHTGTQWPFSVRDRVAEAMAVRPSDVRVICSTIGGGFGGKLDALLEPIAAAAAKKAGRPVKLVNTRREEFATAGPRENGIVRLRSAVTRAGELVAQDVEILLDSGAAGGETVACCSAALLAVNTSYRVGAARHVARTVYTNTPPTAAFRGVCGPYCVWAAERHLDELANAIGMDRREFRLKNLLHQGEHMPNGQEIVTTGLVEAFDRVERMSPWASARDAGPFCGVGIAAITWLTNPWPGGVTMKLQEDGTVLVNAGGTEIGSGAIAMGVTQIVAEELGVNPEDVIVADPDTDHAPYDSGAGGSRTTYSVGNAARMAAGEIRDMVLATASGLLESDAGDLELADCSVRVKGAPEKAVPLAAVALTALYSVGPITGRGRDLTPPPPFDAACLTGAMFTTMTNHTSHVHQCEVEVDPETGKVTILRYVIAQDVGKAINPTGIEGQIHGGVLQGVGYALYEDMALGDDGRYAATNLQHYRLPTALESFPIDFELMEHPAASGPFGAKGVAEPPLVPVAAVVANAVSDAIGTPIDTLPLTPWVVLDAIRRARA